MAPEIIDPPEGRQSTPTASSDTYSFAMTCVEVRLLVQIPSSHYIPKTSGPHRYFPEECPSKSIVICMLC